MWDEGASLVNKRRSRWRSIIVMLRTARNSDLPTALRVWLGAARLRMLFGCSLAAVVVTIVDGVLPGGAFRTDVQVSALHRLGAGSLLAAGSGGIFFAFRRAGAILRRLTDAKFRLCLTCGYQLTGLPPIGVCPECGESYVIEYVQSCWQRCLGSQYSPDEKPGIHQ